MLHTETVEPSTLDLLKRLQRLPELSNIRLVGDTALALDTYCNMCRDARMK